MPHCIHCETPRRAAGVIRGRSLSSTEFHACDYCDGYGNRDPVAAVPCKYGAPMGRRSFDNGGAVIEPTDPPFTLRRIRLDSGGYDAGGAYWGHGAPLYWYCDGIGQCEGFIRASSRDAAKAKIRETYPNARFYR